MITDVYEMCADGIARKKTLYKALKEAAALNGENAEASVFSEKKQEYTLDGTLHSILCDADPNYLKQCVQKITIVDYGHGWEEIVFVVR